MDFAEGAGSVDDFCALGILCHPINAVEGFGGRPLAQVLRDLCHFEVIFVSALLTTELTRAENIRVEMFQESCQSVSDSRLRTKLRKPRNHSSTNKTEPPQKKQQKNTQNNNNNKQTQNKTTTTNKNPNQTNKPKNKQTKQNKKQASKTTSQLLKTAPHA